MIAVAEVTPVEGGYRIKGRWGFSSGSEHCTWSLLGGIIPPADAEAPKQAGVAAVYTPKDFELTRIMRDIVALFADRNGVAAGA